MKRFFLNWPVIVTSGVVFGLFLHPINLVTADLGRHITNGQLTLSNWSIPNTNIYSYTYPDHQFFNHHWLTGVIFYTVDLLGGFEMLSIGFALLNGLAIGLLLYLIWKKSGWVVMAGSLIVFIPLELARLEIRPELFSNLFVAIFLWILWKYHQGEVGWRWLLVLPILSLLWVNLHIYFFLGWGLIGGFWLENLIGIRNKESRMKLEVLSLVGLGSVVICLLNPNWLMGLIRPFQIYDNYGYRVLEEQSVDFLLRILPTPVLYYYFWGLAILIASWIWKGWRVLKYKDSWSLALLGFSIFFSILGWMMLRNFAIFGMVSMLVVGINLESIKKGLEGINQTAIWVGLAIMAVVMMMVSSDYWLGRLQLGIGLENGSSRSAEFVIGQGIKGPIFNNYDIGGFLIYYLYPREKVFVDNRPDAYPAEFFKEALIPAQENESMWQKLDSQYNFQTIFFYYHDATPWGQNFLLNRLKDDKWQIVWVDNYAVVMVKKDGVNSGVVKQYLVPKEVFGVKN